MLIDIHNILMQFYVETVGLKAIWYVNNLAKIYLKTLK